MNLTFENLWPMLQAAGLPGVVIALLVLVLVFIASETDLLSNGPWRRAAVWAMSILFAGIGSGGDAQFNAIVAAIGAVLASLFKLLLDMAILLLKQQRAAVKGAVK